MTSKCLFMQPRSLLNALSLGQRPRRRLLSLVPIRSNGVSRFLYDDTKNRQRRPTLFIRMILRNSLPCARSLDHVYFLLEKDQHRGDRRLGYRCISTFEPSTQAHRSRLSLDPLCLLTMFKHTSRLPCTLPRLRDGPIQSSRPLPLHNSPVLPM